MKHWILKNLDIKETNTKTAFGVMLCPRATDDWRGTAKGTTGLGNIPKTLRQRHLQESMDEEG